MTIELNKAYKASQDVVTKELEDELIIVPIKAGVGDLNAEMFSLNRTGAAVWSRLDGTLSLIEIIKSLSSQYGVSEDEIKPDVMDLIESLLEKGLIFEP
jgi:hypothetical protein